MMSKDTSYNLIDLRDYPSEVLLKKFYHELYLPAFTFASEQENPSVWVPLLRRPGIKPPMPRLHCLILGRHLEEPQRAEIIGGHIFEFYSYSSCGLLTYLVIKPTHRRRGFARLLLRQTFLILNQDANSVGKSLNAVFAEVHKPKRASDAEDSMPTRERLAALARLGAYLVDMPYVQPELVPGQGRSYDLLLLCFPHGQQPAASLATTLIIRFLDEYYRALGVVNPSSDQDFQMMLESLSRGNNVTLKSLAIDYSPGKEAHL